MTSPTPPGPATPARQTPGVQPATDASADSFIRRAGRHLIYLAYGALRAVKLYPVENAAV